MDGLQPFGCLLEPGQGHVSGLSGARDVITSSSVFPIDPLESNEELDYPRGAPFQSTQNASPSRVGGVPYKNQSPGPEKRISTT